MRRFSERQKRSLIAVAGISYTLSLHKYFSRDALSAQLGFQGPLEFGLISIAFICCFLATGDGNRRQSPSLARLCFGAYAIIALASSWRSFNPALSFAKAILLCAVLAIGYLVSQTGLSIRLFQAIYWTYTASLAVGLALAFAFPSRFPLWSVDDFTGRTRLSVYSTFPGTMGETAAYLVLLSPIVFRGSHRYSRLFLLSINLVAGGKTSSALLIILLAVEYLSKIRAVRSWRVVIVLSSICLGFSGLIWVVLSSNAALKMVNKSTDMIYGHDIAGEALSLDGRLALWKSSFSLLQDSPFLGYGFDGARAALVNVAAWSGSSHNGYIELGLAGGLVGLALFLIGLGNVVQACWRAAPFRPHMLPVLAYMSCIALTGVTFNFPSYFGFLILLLLLDKACGPGSLPAWMGWQDSSIVDGLEEQPCQA